MSLLASVGCVTELLRLSVLDQSPIAEGSTGSQALHNTIDLARLTDGLGYHRYWVAEHHGGPMLAGPSPEVLIGPIASATSRMRVGSGGVMLPHYSPLKVAETFSVLAGLYPGPDRPRDRPRRGHRPDDHARPPARPPPGRARRLPPAARRAARLLRRHLPGGALARPLVGTLPGRPETPVPWLLGSSAQSAIWAGDLGLPYAFADFINTRAPRSRRSTATASRRRTGSTRRETAVAVWALAADTDEEAERLAASRRMLFALLRQGRLIPVPPPDKAVRFLETQGASAGPRRRSIVGTPETVRAGLDRRRRAVRRPRRSSWSRSPTTTRPGGARTS